MTEFDKDTQGGDPFAERRKPSDVITIMQSFTMSIQAMNQTLGVLQASLFDINKKLDYTPRNDFAEIMEDIMQDIDVHGKVRAFQSIMEKHFFELRKDLAKYEEFIQTLKEKALKDMCADLEIKKDDMQTRRENKERKFQFWLKALGVIGAVLVGAFGILKGFFGL